MSVTATVARTDAGFDAWKAKVNHFCVRKCGMTTDDLPDCCYRDWYEDGVTASSAAARAVRAVRDDLGC